jgi:2-haloacid dehalogenase
MAAGKRTVAIFDLGGVLIDWDPRHLYRKLFDDDDEAVECFLSTVCTHEWNRGQDAGRSFTEGASLLKAEHPHHAALIDAYAARFDEMMPGPIAGSVEILAELRECGTPLYALSNFSAETFPLALRRFDFLGWFRGILISGDIGMLKPEPGIYRALLDRFAIDPQTAIFIDDVAVNAAGADKVGIHGIHFKTASALRAELMRLGFL